jgi:hypothetical protein
MRRRPATDEKHALSRDEKGREVSRARTGDRRKAHTF